MPYAEDGLYTYAPSDELTPLPALLNKAEAPQNAKLRELRAMIEGALIAGGVVDRATADFLAELQHRVTQIDQAQLNAAATLDRFEYLGREAAGQLTALNGFQLAPGSVIFAIGDVVFLTVNLERSAGVEAVNCVSFPVWLAPGSSTTVQGVASQGGSAGAATIVVGTNGVVRCWTNSTANRMLSVTTFWKRKTADAASGLSPEQISDLAAAVSALQTSQARQDDDLAQLKAAAVTLDAEQRLAQLEQLPARVAALEAALNLGG